MKNYIDFYDNKKYEFNEQIAYIPHPLLPYQPERCPDDFINYLTSVKYHDDLKNIHTTVEPPLDLEDHVVEAIFKIDPYLRNDVFFVLNVYYVYHRKGSNPFIHHHIYNYTYVTNTIQKGNFKDTLNNFEFAISSEKEKGLLRLPCLNNLYENQTPKIHVYSFYDKETFMLFIDELTESEVTIDIGHNHLGFDFDANEDLSKQEETGIVIKYESEIKTWSMYTPISQNIFPIIFRLNEKLRDNASVYEERPHDS